LEVSKRQGVVALVVAASLWLIALESWFAVGRGWAAAVLVDERHVTYYILYSQEE